MSLRTTLTMAQKQTLVMTPKLQQAIKILQMPRLELAQYVSQQLVENPVLEESYEESEEADSGNENEEESVELEDKDGESEADSEAEALDETDEVEEPELDITDDDFGDVNWEEYFDDSGPAKGEWEAPLDDDNRDTLADTSESLAEHLLWQLRMSTLSEEEYAIGEAIIGNIDDDGYLTTDNEEMDVITEIATSLECKKEDVERVLILIQTFDPTGVGARDVKECLLIQLEQLGLADTVAYEIVEEGHLQDLEANRLPQLAKSLGVDLELIRAAADVISSLEPKPGRQFGLMEPGYVVPEVTVAEVDGEYKVFMNDYGPSLRLNPYYRRMLSAKNSLADETKNYINSKMQSAKWLIESIEHRRRTILRVTESIFDIQRDFLDRGPAYLKPLTLSEIAERLDVHEATVSRATRNRYVQTPRGVFELKYFFTSGISTENGEMASSVSVKELIKDMIEKEDPSNPLSDSDIGKQLGQRGYKIARRTIAKYRGDLGIPSSTKRKQW